MFQLVRAGLFVVSLLAAAGSLAEIGVATVLDSAFETNRVYCGYFLCDEKVVATYAYRQQLLGTTDSLRDAIGILRGVVLRDPASAERWIDLGEALAAAGSAKQAQSCIARAVDLGATSADVLVPAGNFYLLAGDRGLGVRYLSRALALTSAFDAAIFSYFAANDVQVNELLKSGVSDEARVAQAYLRYSMSRAELSSARAAWKWVYGHNLVDRKIASDYSDFLISQRQFEEAAAVWASQVRYLSPGYRTTEYLYNAGFESETSPGAYFDWKINPSENVEVTREKQADGWSLRIVFDGLANLAFNHISQKTVLPPGRFRFGVRVKTDSLTTDEGIFFRIADGESPSRLSVETAPLLGTSDWRQLQCSFAVSPDTRVIEVSVNRRPSLRFDNKIKGTIWIERPSLAPL